MDNIIALCLITNYFLDGNYIAEYCRYYLNLGFDFIYLLDDISEQEHALNTIPYIKDKIDEGKIVYIPYEKKPKQWELYKNFYPIHKDEFSWCAFFDSDEFLVLNKHKNIHDFIYDEKLNFVENADSIQICWKMYGDNGHVHKQKGNVMDNYTKPSKVAPKKIETKTIVRGGLNNVDFFIGHFARTNNIKRSCFCDGTSYTVKSPFHAVNYEYASLNHYFCKSTEDYVERKSHGRLDMPLYSHFKVLADAKKTYFAHNEWTQEKEDIFKEGEKKIRGNTTQTGRIPKAVEPPFQRKKPYRPRRR